MKDKILILLKENRDGFISGEKISDKFGVSRSAIWKYMNTLKEEGYEIESIPRKGYRLISSPDTLTYGEVEEYLETKFIGRKIYYFDTIDSTNIKAKELAYKEDEGTLVIAEEQTLGRGRLGRTWISPKKKGIWMSIILKPSIDPMKVAKITQIGAAAIALALEDLGIEAFIKWPNDIVMNGKKVCGILTEMSCELNMINYVIMGVGINVNLGSEDFSGEVSNVGTSLKIQSGKVIDRKKLLGLFLNRFEELYIPFVGKDDFFETLKVCREKSILIGKEVRIIRGKDEEKGKVLGINDDGELIIDYGNGKIENVLSGEVSVRGLYGYV
ncbi:biotin--[acetyl-CoA-carboxylase] ligase [Sporanaerobacter acetigenes]|uniref:Bifunctional ligase/repressor BirA n=1 Tax=Sporanaerobacter acetigenes DSM 13106 TaxID=1123281 RepID=A0A1M5YZ84_9FIRM|nr:biotin--[acetyl-CoA-carboxylase] ligase [Sporanaerobacter acetigenes]SHI16893.1 BirA family transcriptional regulator, biotin operon repressor / biotin-[acetyl-CoA-carboxylase] ligase [Sporanaerobacter acetigenes DSM 13106]